MTFCAEGWSQPPMATCIVIIFAVYALVYQYSTQKLDAREPVVISSGIPFIGHMLGMALHGGKYIKNLG